MAADPDPYYALPMLRGAPAYARPPRVVQESERPFDPDDLPIVAQRMADDLAFTGATYSSASYQAIGSEALLAVVAPASPLAVVAPPPPVGVVVATSMGADPSMGAAPSATVPGAGGSRFRLSALTDRLGPRSK